jgi:SOS-response transcriptional repressor LexA
MASSPPSGPPPVRLVAATRRSTFAPGRGVTLARVEGDGLRAFDLRHGDHVVLERRSDADHGDLALVLEGGGPAALWKVFPEAEGLRLSMGHPALERRAAANAQVQGVVLAVLRGLAPTGSAPSGGRLARRA